MDIYRAKKNKETQLAKEQRYDAIKEAYHDLGDVMNQYQCGKGTGSLGPKPKENFDVEQELIRKEKLRLGLTS
jgi:hypothetical protein